MSPLLVPGAAHRQVLATEISLAPSQSGAVRNREIHRFSEGESTRPKRSPFPEHARAAASRERRPGGSPPASGTFPIRPGLGAGSAITAPSPADGGLGGVMAGEDDPIPQNQ